MQTLKVISIVFGGIICLRFIFRRFFNLPKYNGRNIADDSGYANLMKEDQFWQIIYTTRYNSRRNYAVQCEIIIEELQKYSPADIERFYRTFYVLMAQTYRFRLWEAAYSLNAGCSDDAFHYFRYWLLAQGRNNFYWTLRFPRLLILTGAKELVEHYEGLELAIIDAYEAKTGASIPDVADIEYADPGTRFREDESLLKYPELAFLVW